MTLALSGTSGLLQNYDYQTPVTGFTYTFTAYNALVMNPAGTLATGTITMPAAPVDGMTVTFSSTQIITALTVNANTGQTINNAVTTLAAGQSASYVYRTASTAWFPFSDVSVISVPTAYGGPRAQFFDIVATGQTFIIPTGVTSIKATLTGGGGGGGGDGGGGGGTGATAVKWVTGLTGGRTLLVAVGGAGSRGVGGNNGGSGGTSSVSSGTQTITTVQCTGGGGGGASGGAAGGNGAATGVANGTLITSVVITGTAGQFSCASSTLSVGQRFTISGTLGGTGSITGYTNPTTYYIVATNGSTTFTLSTTYGGSGVTTTAGTPTGLTYTLTGSGAGSYNWAGLGAYIFSSTAGSPGSGGSPDGNVGYQGYVLIEY